MPRKAPNEVTEHRITFGNKERAFIEEMMKQDRANSIIKSVGTVGPSVGILVIGGGIAVAAYAFWSWAGLTDLPGKIKDSIVTTGGNVTAALLGTSVEEQTSKIMDPFVARRENIEAQCREVYNTQSAILASPASSENQKAQANLAIQQNIDDCRRKLNKLSQDVANKASNVTMQDAIEGTWLDKITPG